MGSKIPSLGTAEANGTFLSVRLSIPSDAGRNLPAMFPTIKLGEKRANVSSAKAQINFLLQASAAAAGAAGPALLARVQPAVKGRR